MSASFFLGVLCLGVAAVLAAFAGPMDWRLLLLLVSQLPVDVFQKILAKLVCIDLGLGCSADAIVLAFKPGVRTDTFAPSC